MHAFEGFFQIQLFVFRSIFLQTSCWLVGSPRELYPQLHRDNKPKLHDFLFYINVIISYSFKEFAYEKQACWTWATEGHRHLIYVIATGIGWTIPRGPTEIADLHLCIPRGMGAHIKMRPVGQFEMFFKVY